MDFDLLCYGYILLIQLDVDWDYTHNPNRLFEDKKIYRVEYDKYIGLTILRKLPTE